LSHLGRRKKEVLDDWYEYKCESVEAVDELGIIVVLGGGVEKVVLR
jgi:hypothetical protein